MYPEKQNIGEMAKIEFKKEIKKEKTRRTQNGIIQVNEGNSKTFSILPANSMVQWT